MLMHPKTRSCFLSTLFCLLFLANVFVVYRVQCEHLETIQLGEIDDIGVEGLVKTFPDRPLQLVRPAADHRSLVIVEETLALLQSIIDPVSTIAVVGKFHSGKSFLMNQIMSKSTGFGIGSRVTPETMGIWVWGQPIEHSKASIVGQAPQWILLLDTEGFAANNISENYDAKIFAVATLLSSKLLYNSVKIIDQSDVDYLELLARRTQLFALKAHMANSNYTNDFNQQLLQFPSLMWVVQDFVQETNEANCRDWLLTLLTSHTRDSDSYKISLKDIFPYVDCHTLFIPSAKKDILADLSRAEELDLLNDYREERDQLINKIKLETKPKTKDNRPLTGTDLALLLRALVEAANHGSLTDMPDRWDSFLAKVQQTSVDDCFRFYTDHMDKLLVQKYGDEPMHSNILIAWERDSRAKVVKLLGHLLHGLDSVILADSDKKLNEKLIAHFNQVQTINRQKIELKLLNTMKRFELKMSEQFATLNLPTLTTKLVAFGEKLAQDVQRQFVEQLRDIVDVESLTNHTISLMNTAKMNLNSNLLINSEKMNEYFDKLIETEVDISSVNLRKVVLAKPLNYKLFVEHAQKTLANSLGSFEAKVGDFGQERNFAAKRHELEILLVQRMQELKVENDKFIGNYLSQEASSFVVNFGTETSGEKLAFPMLIDDLDKLLESEMQKARQMFLADYSQFAEYGQVFVSARKGLEANLADLAQQRRKQNLQAYTAEVKTPLKLAKRTILLSADRYSTKFSLGRFMEQSFLVHLEEGKAKKWPDVLKRKIIRNFMEEDEQLAAELALRDTFFYNLIGFFLWLGSFFVW